MHRARKVELPGASARYWPNAIPVDEAEVLLSELQSQVDWDQHRVRMFGRDIPCPRLSSWVGDEGAVYSYSGLRLEPRPWIDPIARIRARVEEFVGEGFNSVLLNLYRDGRDSMGWHADDEPELGPRPLVASVSLGAARRFCLRDRVARTPIDLELANGSLLLLERGLQARYQHSVPKTRKAVGIRVNLTFRQIEPGGHPEARSQAIAAPKAVRR